MILTVDVGNTNITCGVFDKDALVSKFHVSSKVPRTSDEYGMMLANILEQNGLSMQDIKDVIIASVVPGIMHSLQHALDKYLHITPLVIEAGVKTGIRVITPNPQQIGADRIADAVAAYELYGGPAIVVDFGTATTYDLVDESGAYVGGVTAPGIRISAKALWEDAARLPEFEIKKPEHVLGKETISSMQSGLIYGNIGQLEYLVRAIKEENNVPEAKVIVTGGLGRIIASEAAVVDIYDPDLTLKGIYQVYKKQHRK